MIANNLTIERMLPEDIAFIANLEKENFATPWDESALTKTLSDSAETFFVARQSGKCVGYVGLLCGFESADIITLCVTRECRGSGIATQVMQYVFRRLERKGVEKLFLEVRESNAPARALYEKLGFSYLNKRVKYYKDPIEDALVMQKEINSENFSD